MQIEEVFIAKSWTNRDGVFSETLYTWLFRQLTWIRKHLWPLGDSLIREKHGCLDNGQLTYLRGVSLLQLHQAGVNLLGQGVNPILPENTNKTHLRWCQVYFEFSKSDVTFVCGISDTCRVSSKSTWNSWRRSDRCWRGRGGTAGPRSRRRRWSRSSRWGWPARCGHNLVRVKHG